MSKEYNDRWTKPLRDGLCRVSDCTDPDHACTCGAEHCADQHMVAAR